MSMLNWAEKEVELACKKENPNWDGKSFDYGCACYQSALKAYKTLIKDGHSGMSWGITKNILTRLMNNQPLNPITEDDFKESLIQDSDESLKERNLKSSIQCPRMSSLFRKETIDGVVTYSDIDRVICYDIVTGYSFSYGKARKLVDEMFPITLPYMPGTQPYIVEMQQFKYDKNDKHNDWDTESILSVKKPNGEKVYINKYYKLNAITDNWEEITKEDFEKRLEKSR